LAYSKKLVLDFETRSEIDLKKVGAIEYAKHPSTEIICLGWKVGKNDTELWVPSDKRSPLPHSFFRGSNDKERAMVAHNAPFEIAILTYVMPRYFKGYRCPPLNRFRCTAAKAAACALPRGLEGAALALDLPVKKNMDGRRLMLKHTKPRTQWFYKGKGDKYHENEFERWAIYDYCIGDVEVEDLLDDTLPNLTPEEQLNWERNTRANMRGVTIDIPTVEKILDLVDDEELINQRRAIEICGHKVTKRAKVLEWVQEHGADIERLNKESIQQCLINQEDLEPLTRELLELRLNGSKTSIQKYTAMVERAGSDYKVRDYSMFHGASTGRDAGTGLQLHNLPRPSIKDTNLAIDVLNDAFDDEEIDTASFLKLVYGNNMALYSSLVRGMITADKGHELFMADFAAIEARIVAWIGGQEDLLDLFRKGQDPYVKMASLIFNIDEKVLLAKVKQKDPTAMNMRQLGKTAVLGCGFGMGHKKFFEQCVANRVKGITPELAVRAVNIWRKSNKKIVSAWYNIEKAAILATQKKATVKVNRTAWFVRDGFLWCELPSGRRLAYYKPSVRNEPGFGGRLTPRLYHWGVHPKTKQWCETGLWYGTLIENIVQATARDVAKAGEKAIEAAGYNYLFQVHDEIIAQRETGFGDVKEYEMLLTKVPKWAAGLPIAAEAEKGFRYKK
jgi:DNA polymerase